MDNTDVLIIGAGLAGLSTAYHLQRPYMVLETENEPGGKARTIRSGSSTYDFTGHLLHLRKPEIQSLVTSLLPDTFREVQRKAGIFMHDCFLDYPFQANFHPLPREIVKDCLLGFIRAWKNATDRKDFPSFKSWALATFGQGICDHFLFPYNEKLYRTAVENMSADWVSWSVPQPNIEAVIDGALGSVQEGLGYNASFLYPKTGGIEVVPRALARKVDPIIWGHPVIEIEPLKKTVIANSGQVFRYNKLVTTMPLPELLACISCPDKSQLDEWKSGLRWVNVYNLNLTLDAPAPWDWQWLYLPQNEFNCYRIGVSSNISPVLAPKGCSTIYTEYSYLPDEKINQDEVNPLIHNDLRSIGLLHDGVKIIDETAIDLQHSYVVHDQFRMENLPSIMAWLKQHDIISTGRWGAWEYGGMEDALWQGYQAAQNLNEHKN